MNLIPLIGYRWVDTGPHNYHSGMRPENVEDRWKFWAAFRWKDATGNIKVTEMRFLVEPMPDFCGGFLITSPQVQQFQPGSWGTSGFLNPGGSEGTLPSLDWSLVQGETCTRILDLETVTGKANWSQGEVRQYALECMAQSIATEMMSRGKRQFVAADCVGGAMTELAEFMARMPQFIGRTGTVSSYSVIDDLPEKGARPGPFRSSKWRASCQRAVSTTNMSFDVSFGDEWKNRNSGNKVHWITVNLDVQQDIDDDYVECPDCGNTQDMGYEVYCMNCEYEDEALFMCGSSVKSKTPDYVTSPHIMEVYGNRDYVRSVPRYIWRNG